MSEINLTKWGGTPTHGSSVIYLLDGDMNNVLCVEKDADGSIVFAEACDDYFKVKYSKEEALAVVDELRRWIENEEGT